MNTVVIVFTSIQHHSLCWGANTRRARGYPKTGAMLLLGDTLSELTHQRVEQNVFISIYQIEFKTGKTRLILNKKI